MNQKTRFGSITFILVCIAIEVMQAQDFRPGFMIRENGDSVKGFLVYRNDIYNARSCEFRIDENGKTLIYGPGQIKAFGYTGGKYYQSKLLPTEQEPTTLFALVVIRGSMSLYQFEDTFYIEKSDSIVSLSTKTVRIEQEGKEYDEVIKPYSNVLNKMLADCHMNCNDTGLNNMSLTHLVKKYNRCKGDPVEKSNHHKLSWLAVRTSAFVLSDFSNLKLSYFPKYTIDRSTTVTGGIGISVYSPHVNDRISLIVETWYLPKTFTGHYTGDLSNGATGRYDLTYSMTLLKMPLGFGYAFRKNDNTLFIKGGTVNYTWLQEPQGTVITTVYSGTPGLPRIIQFSLLDRALTGFWASVGYTHRVEGRLGAFFELRWESCNGHGLYNSQTSFDSTYTNWTLMGGLTF